MKKTKRKSGNTLRPMKIKTQFSKSIGHSKSSPKREVYRDTGLPQKIRKISNKQPNVTSKAIRKRRMNKAQSQQKEGNNEDQRGNKIEIKKKKKEKRKNEIENINKTKSCFGLFLFCFVF